MNEQHTKNPAAVELGKLGGHARAKALTDGRRKEISVTAAQMRWYVRGVESMRLAVAEVAAGRLSVDGDGRVWRHTYHGKPCAPRLCDTTSPVQPYAAVNFIANGGPRVVAAHRLVWTVLCGDIPDGLQINHIDGDKRNNHPSNLEVVDASGNQRHAIDFLGKHTVPPHVPGDSHGMAKLTWESVDAMRRDHSNGDTMKCLMARYGISHSQATRIVKGQSWREEFRPAV